MEIPPEHGDNVRFLHEFQKETDRGAALVAGAMLDDMLGNILEAYFQASDVTKDLLDSKRNGPLGCFYARSAVAFALGLIEQDEFEEINLIRKIRNEVGHSWGSNLFSLPTIAKLVDKMPWRGVPGTRAKASVRDKFTYATIGLLMDLTWRSKLVEKERRTARVWPQKGMVTRKMAIDVDAQYEEELSRRTENSAGEQ